VSYKDTRQTSMAAGMPIWSLSLSFVYGIGSELDLIRNNYNLPDLCLHLYILHQHNLIFTLSDLCMMFCS
jgi:hypothetical protein